MYACQTLCVYVHVCMCVRTHAQAESVLAAVTPHLKLPESILDRVFKIGASEVRIGFWGKLKMKAST